LRRGLRVRRAAPTGPAITGSLRALSLLALLFEAAPLAPGEKARAATAPPAESVQAVFESGRSARIPIEVGGSGLLFVRARISGTPLWFLLDTASPSILGTRQAIQLGLLPPAALQPKDSSQPAASPAALSNLIVELPGVRVTQPTVSSLDTAPLQTALGHKVDGVLGTRFFGRFAVSIDSEAGVMELFEPPLPRIEEKGSALPLVLDGGLPYLRATLRLPGRPPLSGQFLIDTGADSGVLLYCSFVDKQGLLGRSPGMDSETRKTKGESLEAVSRGESLSLARFVLRKPLVTLSRSTQGRLGDPVHAGLFGSEILRRFRIAFDWARQRIILRPNSHFSEPFDYDASGLTLQTQGSDLSTLEIRRVLPGSPASEAGLRVGDVVLAVDGRSVPELTLHGVRRLLRQDGKEYALSVYREGQILKIHLKCRRLL